MSLWCEINLKTKERKKTESIIFLLVFFPNSLKNKKQKERGIRKSNGGLDTKNAPVIVNMSFSTISAFEKTEMDSVKNTVKEMMIDRGYSILLKKQQSHFFPIMIACNEVEECYIFFAFDKKLGVSELRKFLTHAKQNKVRHCIIVANQGATAFTSSVLQKMDTSIGEMEVELFPYKYLVRNPTRHSLYRPHRALSEEEKTSVLASMNCVNENQLKKLFRTDRICQYFNFPVGTLIETTRNLGSLGPYVSYRIVVNPPSSSV